VPAAREPRAVSESLMRYGRRGRPTEAAEVSVRWGRKWVDRYRAEARDPLFDRSAAPHRIPHRTSEKRVLQAIAVLRRLRFTGPAR
jgi:hypothetical protein